MAKKANKIRRKPSDSPQTATDKYKKYAKKPAAPKKNLKPLLIAIAAVVAVCAVVVVLFASGVFKRHESIDGYWTSDDGFSITIEGDRLVDSSGDEYRIEFSGEVINMYISDDAPEGAGEYFAGFVYKLEGDTLTLYNTSDVDREYPERVFVRSEAPEDSGSDTASSSEDSSESSSDEPDDGIPDFERLGIADDLMEEGVVYPFTTKDYNNEGALAKGNLEVTGYVRSALTENARAFAEEMDVDLTGYESRVVTVKVNFDSLSADVAYLSADYYNAKLFEDNFEPIGVSESGTQYATSKIRYNGVEYTAYMLGDAGVYEDDAVYRSTDVWEAIVPEGYDGVCVGYYNTQLVDNIPDEVSKAYSYDYYKKGDMYFFRCA